MWKDILKESKPTFRNTRFGLEMDKDGKTYFSYGRNEKGTKSSLIERFQKDMPDHEFIIGEIPIEGTEGKGKVEFVFGRKKEDNTLRGQ